MWHLDGREWVGEAPPKQSDLDGGIGQPFPVLHPGPCKRGPTAPPSTEKRKTRENSVGSPSACAGGRVTSAREVTGLGDDASVTRASRPPRPGTVTVLLWQPRLPGQGVTARPGECGGAPR